MGSRVVAIIPARYESTRFPGKPLAEIAGKPMIRHVYERTRAVPSVGRVVVATDDERIEEAVRGFGGEVMRTADDHPSGTDRIAEVAAALDDEIVVNVQGDVPFLAAEMVDAPVGRLEGDPDLCMTTVCAPIRSRAERDNPNVVKVVTDLGGRALYFSRSPIPFVRDAPRQWGGLARHIGLYVYRREFLLRYAALEPTPLEKAEKLEQLRALEHGFAIGVVRVDHSSIEVDTPEDLERAREHAAALAGTPAADAGEGEERSTLPGNRKAAQP